VNFDYELERKYSNDPRSPHYKDGYTPKVTLPPHLRDGDAPAFSSKARMPMGNPENAAKRSKANEQK